MMEAGERKLLPNHEAVVRRFVEACQAEGRVLAAFLGGSYARGAADEFSDLDLYLITTDEGFNEFWAQREAFLHLLGEPVFMEDFDIPDIAFYVLADGTEGELGFGWESHFDQIHRGPYQVLVDKKNILRGAVFTGQEPEAGEQAEKLRRMITWFWHELSHFITAMGRGQLWWAQGQLEALRGYCVNLARLRNNFLDIEAGDEAYFKIEKAVPVEQLSTLEATFCRLEAEEMLKAGRVVVGFYKELAIPLARRHGIPYPEALERVMMLRLEKVHNAL